MSFKREGDDKDQLSLLRQRRIRDLVCEDIPDDEAKLLSNGKLTCLVCNYNPIFDTVAMLLVHRAGKKHKQGAAIFLEKQRNLKHLIEKRKAEHYDKFGNTNIQIAKEHLNNRHLETWSTPYDARSKKLKPFDRKPKLHVRSMSGTRSSTETSHISDLPGSSGAKWGHLQTTTPIMHDSKLKNMFRKREQSCEDIKPYISKRRNCEEDNHDGWDCNIIKNSESSSNLCRTNQNSGIFDRNPQTPTQSSTLLNTSQSLSTNQTNQRHLNSKAPITGQVILNAVESVNSPPPTPHITGQVISNAVELINSPPPTPIVNPSNEKTDAVVSSGPKPLTEVRRQFVSKIQQLRGAGWKRDWDGKWIKDEDAEFDSDEEAPDL